MEELFPPIFAAPSEQISHAHSQVWPRLYAVLLYCVKLLLDFFHQSYQQDILSQCSQERPCRLANIFFNGYTGAPPKPHKSARISMEIQQLLFQAGMVQALLKTFYKFWAAYCQLKTMAQIYLHISKCDVHPQISCDPVFLGPSSKDFFPFLPPNKLWRLNSMISCYSAYL